MITSIFSKSKPINIIIVSGYILLVFLFCYGSEVFGNFTERYILLINLLILLFSLFVIDFIISKNNLTKKNSFVVLFFGLFIGLFPEVFLRFDILWSNLFLLFALRRLISLHSKKNIKKKLFDAGFWVGLAILLNPWSVLLFAVILAALAYYASNDIKTIVVPFLGLLCVAVIKLSYNILRYDRFFDKDQFSLDYSLNFEFYNTPSSISSLTVFLSFFIWALVVYLKKVRDKTSIMKPVYYLMFVFCILSFFMVFLSPQKLVGELLYLLAPTAIIMTVYFQTIQENWFRNLIILLFLSTPIISLFF